jgi:hypothetical protein
MIWYQLRGALFLARWPPDLTFSVLWIQEKGTQTCRFPNGAPMERTACLQGLFFYIPLKFLIKISLNKEVFPFLKDPRKGVSLYVPQKQGPYGNKCPLSKPYLAYPSGSPVKEPSLQVPLIELPWREMPSS